MPAPVQAVVTTITSDADAYAGEVLKQLKDAGIRAEYTRKKNERRIDLFASPESGRPPGLLRRAELAADLDQPPVAFPIELCDLHVGSPNEAQEGCSAGNPGPDGPQNP